MLRPAITQLISKNDSYYSLVIGVAKRAREIADELVEQKKTLEEKPVKTAVEEFANGKFRILEAKKENKTPDLKTSAPQECEQQEVHTQEMHSQEATVQISPALQEAVAQVSPSKSAEEYTEEDL